MHWGNLTFKELHFWFEVVSITLGLANFDKHQKIFIFPFYPSDGLGISTSISGQLGGGGGGCQPPFHILITGCLTFCLLLTYILVQALSEYKFKVVNICKMHWR